MSEMLYNPSFKTKQRILRLVVDKILVSEAASRHRLRRGTTLALRGWGFKPHP